MWRPFIIIAGYVSVALVVLGVSGALVAYGLGYAYDIKTGRLIRTGLVIIQSDPAGVLVSRNGHSTKKKTTYRASFEAGSYLFELTKDGFRPWHKALEVIASEVTLAQYAILLPVNPATHVLDSRSAIVAQSISKDHRHLAYVAAGAEPAVYSLDVSADNAKPAKLYSPAAATAEAPAEVLTGVTWSDDASHVLIISTVGAETIHHLVAADGTSVINLTQTYGFNFTGLTFSATDWHQLYWVSTDGLRRLDVGSKVVSAVLAERVGQFVVAPGRVLYVQASLTGVRSVWSIDSGGRTQELIPALPESDTYALDAVTYKGQEELAVVPAKTGVGTLYSGIYGPTPVAKTIARGVTSAQFSPDGHVLAFSGPTNITTYDLERSQLTAQSVIYAFSEINQLTQLTWYDNFHLLTNQAGHLKWLEFDGANAADLGVVTPELAAYGSSDGHSIQLFRAGTKAGVAVQQLTDITIKP